VRTARPAEFRRKAREEPFARVRLQSPCVERVGPDSYRFIKTLGKGTFGEVFQVESKQTQEAYAMKVIDKSRVASGKFLRYTLTERNVLSYIRHPYIVSLHHAFQTPKHLVLVLQLCSRGNLSQLIYRERSLKETLARHYTAEVLLALCHVHARNILFRDLKPDNVVIDENWHCLLTDFGLSKELVPSAQTSDSFCGSMAFIAPEILMRQEHSTAVDIYGLGVILFNMLTGLPPYYNPDRNALCENIKRAPLRVPFYVSKTGAELVRALMEREPSKRLGACCTSEIQAHPYFSRIDFNALLRREVPVPEFSFQHRAALSKRQSAAGAHVSSPFRTCSKRGDSHWGIGRGSTRGQNSEVAGWSFVEVSRNPSCYQIGKIQSA